MTLALFVREVDKACKFVVGFWSINTVVSGFGLTHADGREHYAAQKLLRFYSIFQSNNKKGWCKVLKIICEREVLSIVAAWVVETVK